MLAALKSRQEALEETLRQRLEAMVRAGALETAPGPRGTCYRAVGGEEV